MNENKEEGNFITWEKIRNIKREEENSEGLVKLPDDFFPGVNEYIKKKTKLGNDYEVKQIKSMLDDIIKIRTKKVLRYSVYSADANELDNLTEKEEEIQNTVVELINDYKESVGLEASKKEKEDDIKEETKVKDLNVQEVKLKPGKVLIRVLDDIPEFVGLDMEEYNLQNGDLVTIHEEIADLLIDQGKAEKVELK